MTDDGPFWEIDTCSCGFSGGDSTEEYETEEEVRQAFVWLEDSNSSIIEIRRPDGTLYGNADHLGLWGLPPSPSISAGIERDRGETK